MSDQKSLNDLIKDNQIYNNLSDKLEIPPQLYDKSISQICVELNLNIDLIQTLLKSYDDNFEFPYKELNEFSIQEILNYLKLTHRYYLYKKLPDIEQAILHIFKDNSDPHQLLILMCHYFVEFKKKLVEHIQFEEKKFFPYIQQLIDLENSTNKEEIASVLNQNSIKAFLDSHSDVEYDLQQVRKTILEHTDSSKMPLQYSVFLVQLQNFEIDLCKHNMIEDNVLVEKVIALESALREGSTNPHSHS